MEDGDSLRCVVVESVSTIRDQYVGNRCAWKRVIMHVVVVVVLVVEERSAISNEERGVYGVPEEQNEPANIFGTVTTITASTNPAAAPYLDSEIWFCWVYC